MGESKIRRKKLEKMRQRERERVGLSEKINRMNENGHAVE